MGKCSFVRDIESASERLDDSSKNTTVLAPLNSAIEKLPRKPWEDPRDYGALGPNAYEGGDGHERAQQNLRRFVERHMVPLNPWPEGKNAKAIGDDQTIWWEEKNGVKVVSNVTNGTMTTGQHTNCVERYNPRVLKFSVSPALSRMGRCG